jgi:hypothetical protein
LTLNTNHLTGTVPTSLASLPLLSTSTLALLFLYYFVTIFSHVCTYVHCRNAVPRS